jgi:hypothetical protein
MGRRVNEIAQYAQVAIILSGPVGAGAVWWFKRRDDAKLRTRVDECERDRARLGAELVAAKERITTMEGSINTLTSILRKETNIG